MAFGFPAHHKEAYVPDDAGGDLRPLVLKTLAALFWPILRDQEEAILAATDMNLRSIGEKVTIEFGTDGSLTVASKCRFVTQCLDWGRNKGNVEKFMAELRKQVARSAGGSPAGVDQR